MGGIQNYNIQIARKTNKRAIAVSGTGVLYIILLSIAELRQSNLISMYYLTTAIVSGIFVLFGAVLYLKSANITRKKNIFSTAKSFIVPWIVFFFYNIFIFISGNGERAFLKSSFVQILIPPIILLGAFAYYYVLKGNALRYFVYSIVIHYIFLLGIQLIQKGPVSFIQGTLTVFSGNSTGNPFETNSDLVLSLGLLLIYYSDKFVKIRDKNNKHAILTAVLILLGGKKISFIALVLICVFFILSNRISDRKKIKIERIVSVVFIVGCLLYIFLVDSGLLSSLVASRGIDTMGRMRMYNYIGRYISFSPTFLGKGYSFANLMLEKDMVHTYNGKIYGLHSDILKIYVEMGFILFVLWLIYFLLILPDKIDKKYGPKVSNLFWFMTIYLFVTYLTDNTINYFITQSLYIILLLNSMKLSPKDPSYIAIRAN